MGRDTCLPQRGALIKSLLIFLKKAIKDSTFSDSFREIMDGSLSAHFKHVISNPGYYASSLELLGPQPSRPSVFPGTSVVCPSVTIGMDQLEVERPTKHPKKFRHGKKIVCGCFGGFSNSNSHRCYRYTSDFFFCSFGCWQLDAFGVRLAHP